MRGWILIVFLALLSACSLVTEVDVPASPPGLVVNSFFHPDSTFKIYVSQHWHILARDAGQPTGDVVITLSDQNGAPVNMDEYQEPQGSLAGDPSQRAFRSTQKALAGNIYSINITVPGFPAVHATAATPALVELSNVWLDSANLVPHNDYSSGSIPIEFTFQDPPGKGDYYYLSFVVGREQYVYDPVTRAYTDTTMVWEPGSLKKSGDTEVIAELGDNVVEVLSDELFDGKLHTVRLYVVKNWWSNKEPKSFPWKLKLVHVKEEYYKYVRSKRLQDLADGNPFAQPVQVYSNINGGLGIFAGSATSTWYQPN